MVAGQRLRKGACGSGRGAARMIADALTTVRRLRSTAATGKPLMRADSAFYGHPSVSAAIRGGADVSITVRLDPKVKAAIAEIGDDAWIPIEYTDALYDETTQQWVSRAEVAEIRFTAFSSRKVTEQVEGRLVVRRIPDLNHNSNHGQRTLFDTWRFHAFFTTTDLDTVTADKTHRGHAIIEQVHADLKDSALAHLPSGRFTANAAWLVLVVIAFNLTRAAATITGTALAQAPDRHHPPHAGHGARTDRILGATPDPAPTARLAMGIRLERVVRQPVSPTQATHRLTRALTGPVDTKDPQEQPDTPLGPSATPTSQHTPTSTRTIEINITPTVDRWIEVKRSSASRW